MRNRRVWQTKLLPLPVTLVLIAAACSPDGQGDEPTDNIEGEVPALAELVEQGELPPMAERLPDEPMVVEPNDRIGSYGGEWRTALLGPADTPWLSRTIAYEHLLRWNQDFTEPIPNIAADYEVNEDATEYTFFLREDVKWSDGEPFTAADIVFWYEAVATNEELSPQPPDFMVTEGEAGVVEQVDEHTVRFTFPGGPNGLLPELLASPGTVGPVATPRHYLEQFHEDYNPDVDQLVAEEGLEDWAQLFELRAGVGSANAAPDLPTLYPWTMMTELSQGTQVTFERNPYYWKTDTEGNQLPYIDQVTFDVVEDSEVILLKALNGELDMHARHITAASDRPVLAQGRESGNYDFFELAASRSNELVIALNLTHKDDAMREVLQNKDFRIGLSHAINRQEIIDAVYARQGEPYQVGPRPDSKYFNEQLAYQYTDYDPELAEQHLDRAGYTDRDSAGFRLGPDGARISISVEVSADGQDRIEALQLIEDDWAEAGVELNVNPSDRSLITERQNNNEHDAFVWGGDGAGGQAVILDPFWYFPQRSGGIASAYAKLWAWWHEGDERGEEPPAATQKQIRLYQDLTSTSNADEQVDLMHQILEIAAEEFYVMGVALSPDTMGIVHNDFHNVPDSVPEAWQAVTPALANPEQFFIER